LEVGNNLALYILLSRCSCSGTEEFIPLDQF